LTETDLLACERHAGEKYGVFANIRRSLAYYNTVRKGLISARRAGVQEQGLAASERQRQPEPHRARQIRVEENSDFRNFVSRCTKH